MSKRPDKNTRIGWQIILSACIFSLAACLSEISLDVPEGNNASIAIRGRLTGGALPMVSVKITNISDFSPSSIPSPVSGASVVLIDAFNNGLDIPMRSPGVYELEIPEGAFGLEVKPNQAYQLSVATADGNNYLSAFETLHAVPEPIELRYTSVRREVLNEASNLVDQEFVRFLLTTPVLTPESSSRSYLKWDFAGTYKFIESTVASPFPPNTNTCYITERLNLENVVVFDGSQNDQDILRDYFLLEEPFDFRFSNGFYLTLRQQSLTVEAYRYWDQIGKVVKLSGNFFESPPGKVIGNFRNVDDPEEEVFGYFYTTEETISRLYVDPGNDPPIAYCPLTTASVMNIDTTCLDCLLRAGSTLIKPAFWER